MIKHEKFMRRCFTLARLGAGSVSPNPMVGAVIVYQDRIIGEGWHQAYGGPHAEVNAVQSVREEDRPFLKESTIYVSLEPCCIFGRTPPCTNLIIDHGIPCVVISCLDATPEVSGQGVHLLREAGVDVITGVLEAEGRALAAIRNTYAGQNRPYIILKYARTYNGFFARSDRQQFWITNNYTKRLTHRWRSEVDAMLIGTETALQDNPRLNNRLYFGHSPLRIVLDRQQRLPRSLHLFDGASPTLLVTEKAWIDDPITDFKVWQTTFGTSFWTEFMAYLHQQKISSLMVEGGARLLQDLIDKELWDEARVLTGPVHLGEGIPAPTLPVSATEQLELDGDLVYFYKNKSDNF